MKFSANIFIPDEWGKVGRKNYHEVYQDFQELIPVESIFSYNLFPLLIVEKLPRITGTGPYAKGRLEDSGWQNDEKMSRGTVHSLSCAPFFRLLPSSVFHLSCCVKPGFHIVVSVVSVVRKKFIGPIEFILSRTTSCICRFCCIEQLYGRFP